MESGEPVPAGWRSSGRTPRRRTRRSWPRSRRRSPGWRRMCWRCRRSANPRRWTTWWPCCDGSWTVVLSEHPDARGIRVGFLTTLTRCPPGRSSTSRPVCGRSRTATRAADTSAAMGRGGLHLRVEVDGADWDLVTVHLKSKLLTFPGGRFAPDRRGSAGQVRCVCAVPAGRRGRHRPGARRHRAGRARVRTGR